MISLTLPDGAKRKIKEPISGADFAASISKSLSKKAIAMKLNGELKDLATMIEADADISVITPEDKEGLEILRHDCAHVMAQAVQELFPDTQVTIGPVIENGFFYDFARKEPFHLEDLEKIEARMHEIVKRNEPIIREIWKREEAIAHFKEIGESYKAEIIGDIPKGEEVSIYRQGEWKDLCRGPHLPSTGRLGKAFTLTKLAGAYWRGDANNEMLQRIYGTCWAKESELAQYLHMVEEAEKRDHRRIGKEMQLFHLQEEAQGMIFWHEKGWALYQELKAYMRRQMNENDYKEVHTPSLVDRSLWEKSGHWEKFHEHMFLSQDADERVLAIKPMNCPCHVQIFNQGIKSYRDLPLRMSEFGSCHRYEHSGALHGLMRLRGFVQDDGHIFCTEEQITSETKIFCEMLQKVYKHLGFEEVRVMFADRPEVRVGADDVWDRAEASLLQAVKETKIPYEINPGEGAFYGPKLEFHLKDAIGRSWQCGTLQLDFNMAERLGASYIGKDSNRHVPVIIHRAILGSLERFIGILIEQYEGKFPLWLAPTQIVVATIVSDADSYAKKLHLALGKAGLRSHLDIRNEKINYKIREHLLGHVPVLFICGKREAAENTISIRRLGEEKQSIMKMDEAIQLIQSQCIPPDLNG